jgi:hypothetical protein
MNKLDHTVCRSPASRLPAVAAEPWGNADPKAGKVHA